MWVVQPGAAWHLRNDAVEWGAIELSKIVSLSSREVKTHSLVRRRSREEVAESVLAVGQTVRAEGLQKLAEEAGFWHGADEGDGTPLQLTPLRRPRQVW